MTLLSFQALWTLDHSCVCRCVYMCVEEKGPHRVFLCQAPFTLLFNTEISHWSEVTGSAVIESGVLLCLPPQWNYKLAPVRPTSKKKFIFLILQLHCAPLPFLLSYLPIYFWFSFKSWPLFSLIVFYIHMSICIYRSKCTLFPNILLRHANQTQILT